MNQNFQQTPFFLQQPPLHSTEVENHDTLYQLVDDLLQIIEDNKKLKDEIWKDMENISRQVASISEDDDTDNPAAFKYNEELNKLKQLKEVNSQEDLQRTLSNSSKHNSLFSEIKSKFNATGEPEKANGPKDQIISQLKRENEDLIKVLVDRKKYNTELVKVMTSFEDSIQDIEEGIARKHIEVNTRMLNKQEEYKDTLIGLEAEMYAKFQELIELEQGTSRLYGKFDKFLDAFDRLDLSK